MVFDFENFSHYVTSFYSKNMSYVFIMKTKARNMDSLAIP